MKEVIYSTTFSEYISDVRYIRFEEDSPSTFFLPLGNIHIVFHLNGLTQHKAVHDTGWESRPQAFWAGPFTTSYDLRADRDTELFVLQIKPGRSKYFHPADAWTWRNQLIPLSDVWGTEGGFLAERVCSSESNAERIALVDDFLQRYFRDIDVSSVEYALKQMIQKKGTGKISTYAKISGLSDSHFRKTFKAEVGLSPKEMQRIIRINAMSDHFFKHPSTSLTNLSYQYDFFDQSHFIKSFRLITGKSPKQYFNAVSVSR